MEEVLKLYGELTEMFNGVKLVIIKHLNDSYRGWYGDVGHDVVQKDLQGSGEVSLILQVTSSTSTLKLIKLLEL